MSASADFVDYYEVLEASPRASQETLERLYRLQAQRFHPDSNQGRKLPEFLQVVEAYEVLKNPDSREAYDNEYWAYQEGLTKEPSRLDSDSVDRHKILTALYMQRRQNMRQPGMGDSSLEDLVGCTPDVLNFHLWYFREQGWIRREDSGAISITAAGVDQIESVIQRQAEMENRLLLDRTRRRETSGRRTATC